MTVKKIVFYLTGFDKSIKMLYICILPYSSIVLTIFKEML